MSQHVRKGDTVMVIAGDDKGKTGEVMRVDPRSGKVLVQGVNRVYRHMKPSRQHPQGGRIQKEKPIDMSNVLPVDPKTNQPTRVRFVTGADGSKQRMSVKSGTALGVVRKASKSE
jgi:large subunit ribosomal protein L24